MTTNSVTVLARIDDDEVAALRERLRSYGPDSPFSRVPGTHFARLVVVEHAVRQQRPAVWRWPARLLDLVTHGGRGPKPDDLPHPYLLMTATVDGEPASFFGGLRGLGPEADGIWGHCTDYPGHADNSFQEYFEQRSLPADYTFAGAPDGTVGEIREALRLRRQLASFAANAADETEPRPAAAVHDAPGAGMWERPGDLELDDIQALVLRGFGSHHVAAHLFLRVIDGEKARRWLRTVIAAVTSAAQVCDRPDRALHLGLSHHGLARIGVGAADLAAFPEEFRTGMYAREADLSPGVGTGPWRGPFDAPEAVDVVLLLSATDSAVLDPWLAQVRADLQEIDGLRVVGEQHGRRLTDDEGRFTEHFGFADGLSRPGIAGYDAGSSGQVLPAGEVVLGQDDVDGDVAGRSLPPGLARNGSFLAYRKLEQDVAAFRALTGTVACRFAEGAEGVAAGLVGRRRDGKLLDECPAGAHVRRANPGESLPGGTKLTRRHLMQRRGIPYGPALPAGAEDDGEERGLLFLAVVGDLGRQFEFVQTEWLGDGNVFGRGDEQDIFTTAGGPGARILIEGPQPTYVNVPAPLVTCRGGEYFLLPGLAALTGLAGENAAPPAPS
jgi:Dyp-type peroxidase family